MNNAVHTLNYAELFNGFAGSYRLVDRLSFGLAERLRGELAHDAGLNQGDNITDLMCGPGNMLRHLARKGVRYRGIDISHEMLALAANKHEDKPEARFILADILDYHPQEPADHVLCSYGLKCVPISSYPRFAAAVIRNLKPGGRFSFLEFRSPANPLLGVLFRFYLSTVYLLACRIFTGQVKPASELLNCLSQPPDLVYLRQCFLDLGSDINIGQKWNGSVLVIKGSKPKRMLLK